MKILRNFVNNLCFSLVVLAFGCLSSAYADSVDSMPVNTEDETLVVESFDFTDDIDLSETEDELEIAVDMDKVLESEKYLERFSDELDMTETYYRQVLSDIESTEFKLKQLGKQAIDLEFQINNLDSSIEKANERFFSIIKQSIEAENELELLSEKLEISKVAYEVQIDALNEYILAVYEQDNQLSNMSPVAMILSGAELEEIIANYNYFDVLTQTGANILDKLEEIEKQLAYYEAEFDEQLEYLNFLKAEAQEEQKNLEEQKAAKELLLTSTKGQELIYEQLLEQSKIEQASVKQDVDDLGSALALLRADILEGNEFDSSKYDAFLGERGQILFDFYTRYRGIDDFSFSWPVSPNLGISAYFRDPSYSSVFGVRHNAIDIPIYQGSTLRSAGNGVVYAAKDNGYGYSYIIIAHPDGFSTVYGHVSKILVRPGDSVRAGTIIGLSGGMPGTKGAGYMTTGPHLHFEVLKDSEYVDPLLYLPLSLLPEEKVSNLPEKYQLMWEKEIEEIEKSQNSSQDGLLRLKALEVVAR